MERGKLIVFEGLDRVGKSSQVELLISYFKNLGEAVEIQRFPDRNSSSGKMLNDILINHRKMDIKSSHLLFSFNRWEKMDEIEEKLKNKINLIVDRYAFSGVAYSIANGAPKEYSLVPDQGLIRPDIVIQLDMPFDLIKNRDGFGNEIYEREDTQLKVQENFKLFHNKKYWNLVNANNTKENIHKDVIKLIESMKYDKDSINKDLFMSEYY